MNDFPSDLSRVFSHEESAKLESAAMEWSEVPEALMTVCAARDKMMGKGEGKGERAVSLSGQEKGKGRRPSSAKQLQDKQAARKAKSTCHECGRRGRWAGDPGCSGTRDAKCTTWSDEYGLPTREEFRAIMMGRKSWTIRCFSFVSRFARSVCTASVTSLQKSPVTARAGVKKFRQINNLQVSRVTHAELHLSSLISNRNGDRNSCGRDQMCHHQQMCISRPHEFRRSRVSDPRPPADS